MIYTIGHSTLPKGDFVEACKLAGAVRIFDVRSHPGSNANPQYNRGSMQRWLRAAGIGYEWLPELGGWTDRHAVLAAEFAVKDVDVMAYCHNAFPRQRISKPCPHGFSCYGFYDYQYFQTLDEYLVGIKTLTQCVDTNGALMCCEARFVQCHRAMIADHLGLLGIEVQHIEPRFRKIKEPRTVVKLTGHGKFLHDRLARYDPEVLERWRSPI